MLTRTRRAIIIKFPNNPKCSIQVIAMVIMPIQLLYYPITAGERHRSEKEQKNPKIQKKTVPSRLRKYPPTIRPLNTSKPIPGW
jgi:hypothetical protein